MIGPKNGTSEQRSTANESSDTELREKLASEIIARLFLIHRVSDGDDVLQSAVVRGSSASFSLCENDRTRFVGAVRAGDVAACNRQLDELVARQVSGRELLLGLLGRTAERLGVLWEEDEADFAEVTLGLCNLHRILRERNWTPTLQEHSPILGLSLLMTTFTGEQHVFAAMIVAEIFRRKGWSVTTLPGGPHTEVCAALGRDFYDVVGVSATTLDDEGLAEDEILSMRAASRNPELKVVVGGRAFAEDRELCMRIGADAMADSVEGASGWRPACG